MLEAKRTMKTPLKDMKEPVWKNYVHSCRILEERGIRVTKLNYSNLGSEEMKVTLTNNRHSLTFEAIETKTCCSKIFGRKKRTFPLSSFVGAFYGGTTSTFKLHLQDKTMRFCREKQKLLYKE